MKSIGPLVFVTLFCVVAFGQHSSQDTGTAAAVVEAQKPYQIMAGEKKLPVLALYCVKKGKNMAHVLTFSPKGNVSEDNLEVKAKDDRLSLPVQLGSDAFKPATWIPYGDAITFAYYGRTEPERLTFIESLLNPNVPTLTVSFTPFLTGTTVTSVFDLGQFRSQVEKHPECGFH